jgi:hypothetical protein
MVIDRGAVKKLLAQGAELVEVLPAKDRHRIPHALVNTSDDVLIGLLPLEDFDRAG